MTTAHDAIRVSTFTYSREAYSQLCDVITDVFREAVKNGHMTGYVVDHIHGPGSTMVTEPDGKTVTYVSIFLNNTEEETRHIIGNRDPIPVMLGASSDPGNGDGTHNFVHVPCIREMTLRDLARSAFAAWLFNKDAVIAALPHTNVPEGLRDTMITCDEFPLPAHWTHGNNVVHNYLQFPVMALTCPKDPMKLRLIGPAINLQRLAFEDLRVNDDLKKAKQFYPKLFEHVSDRYFVRIISHKGMEYPPFPHNQGAGEKVENIIPDICMALDAIASVFNATPDDLQSAASRHHDWDLHQEGILHQYSIPDDENWRDFAACAIALTTVWEVTVLRGPDYLPEQTVLKVSRDRS